MKEAKNKGGKGNRKKKTKEEVGIGSFLASEYEIFFMCFISDILFSILHILLNKLHGFVNSLCSS